MSSNDWRKHASYKDKRRNQRPVTRPQPVIARVPVNLDDFAAGHPELIAILKSEQRNKPSSIIPSYHGNHRGISKDRVDSLELMNKSEKSPAESSYKSNSNRKNKKC